MHQHGLRDNVALLVLLQTAAGAAPWPTYAAPGEPPTTPQILIANTHVLFNPKRGDIKVGPLHQQFLQHILYHSASILAALVNLVVLYSMSTKV